MYIHYARIEFNGKRLVQLLFCSRDHLDYSLTEQKNKAFTSKNDWRQMAIPVVSMLKQIPSNQRNYDNENKVWTILETKWDALIDILKVMGFKFKSYTNLYIDLIDIVPVAYAKTEVPKIEDFFYNEPIDYENQLVSSGPTIEDIINKLNELLETKISIDKAYSIDLKKLYRKAAMKYHPDLNGGDTSKMTELNYYWQEYQKVRTNV